MDSSQDSDWEYWKNKETKSWINHKLKEVYWKHIGDIGNKLEKIQYGVYLDDSQTELMFHILAGFKFQCMVKKAGDIK